MAYNNNNAPSGTIPAYGAPKSGYSNNSGTGYKKSKNKEIDGVLLYNDSMGKFLKTRFWSRCLAFDIGTYKPGSEINSDLIKNAQIFSHSIGFSSIIEFLDVCEDVYDEIKRTGNFKSASIIAGQKKDAIIEISNGSNINMPAGIYLCIYKNLDPNKRTNNMEIYPFNSTKVLYDYNHTTGAANEEIKHLGNFKKFIVILREAANAFTMSQAHAIKEASKNEVFGIVEGLARISASMGIDVSKTVENVGSGAYSTYKKPSGGYSKNNYQPKQFTGRTSRSWNNPNNGYNNNGAPQSAPVANNAANNSYQIHQQLMNSIADANDPVDINIDMATLQQVDMSDFS